MTDWPEEVLAAARGAKGWGPAVRALTVVIHGPPASWQRATVVKGRTMTPKAMRAAKAHARAAIQAAAMVQRWTPATGPVRVTLEFIRRRKPDAVPDVDNLAKLPLDSANGIAWDDDARVVELRATKRRAGDGELERTVMTVEVLT